MKITTLSPDDLDKHPVATGSALDDAVPVIDVGALTRSGDGADSRDAVDAIARACERWGFFQVINHGVAPALIDDVWRQARGFFELPLAAKESILRTRANPWGYYHNELTKNQRDRKEVFDFTAEGVDPIYGAENRWLLEPAGFRDTMLAYFAACSDLSLRLLEAFCLGLGVERDHLHGAFADDHTGFVRLNHYPVEDPLSRASLEHLHSADMGVHHHTDAGALTVLLQDEVGGLQVYRDGLWHDVKPVAGAFVINTGDMMQVWSNDRYQAAMHRVLAMRTADRMSIPFFYNPTAETRIDPLPSLVGPDKPARYSTIHWAAYRGKRTDGDYADYGTEVQIAQFRR